MYKLLIVDDEPWIKERLRDTIDWASLDVAVAGTADDGLQALELAECLKPEIILTDIRMPAMDGLELIRGLKENGNPAKVIIISGYQDFEYAQKAIKLGAFDYILKPVDDGELAEIVKRCTGELLDRTVRELMMAEARKQIEESRPSLRELFIINLVNGSTVDISGELARLGMGSGESTCICFVLLIDEPEPDATAGQLLRSALYNIVSDFIKEPGTGECFFTQEAEATCLLYGASSEEELTRQAMTACSAIRQAFKDATGRTVTIGMGRAYGSLMMAAVSCKEAREALQYRACLGRDSIYDIKSLDLGGRRCSYRPSDLETLVNNIKAGNRQGALSALDALIACAADHEDEVLPIDLKLMYIDIMNTVLKSIPESSSTREEFSAFSMDFYSKLNKLQTMKEAQDWLSDAIGKVADLYEKDHAGRPRKVISRALEYINNNFRKPLTLNLVAEQFYFNPSYFCKIFKQETGEAFTRYLINLRIARAKELLDDPKLKIYEVAALVGYEDVQYFTKIFKAVQGVTPMTYRERVR